MPDTPPYFARRNTGGALGIPADGFVLAISGFSLGDAPAADRAPSSSDNGL